ncbi:hypothetical protein V6N13_135945 [Hibiscus sabdariffa]|uniref:Uncharacterized protein n=2 Tax=Hibiscus sabdariffa TaxID=183260 RepID=A0ABR2QSY9_9ROSI
MKLEQASTLNAPKRRLTNTDIDAHSASKVPQPPPVGSSIYYSITISETSKHVVAPPLAKLGQPSMALQLPPNKG